MASCVRWKGLRLVPALLLLALGLSGCVYLRLFTVRNQLQDFDRFIAVGGEPDLALTFKQPVLLSEDLVVLFKQPPTEQRQMGESKALLWVLEKDPMPKAEAGEVIRFTFSTIFTSNKLTQLVIPREVFRVVPRQAAVSMFKAMGHARVNTGHRSADTEMAPVSGGSRFECSKEDVTRLLGLPQEAQSTGTTTTWNYRFGLVPPPEHPNSRMRVRAKFVFRNADDRLTQAQLEFGGHQVNVRM
jgi:hypothetical protein